MPDLPKPDPAESVRNQPHMVPRPKNAWPIAPAGFKVTLYAGGDNEPSPSQDQQHSQQQGTKPAETGTFRQPRLIRTAAICSWLIPMEEPSSSCAALVLPVRPDMWNVSRAGWTIRLGLHSSRQPIPEQLAGGGHWTRDVVFSKDGQHMLLSVGSGSNIDNPDDHPKEFHRANILEFTPEGKFLKVYASGLRNCVGEAINPITGMLWCSTNERDELGNHLVPDYVT